MNSTGGGSVRGLLGWLGNVWLAVSTVAGALRVTMRYWCRTYDPQRRTFTEQFEYPELPLQVAPRYKGFHRYDLTECIACGRCAKDCPANCIYIGKKKAEQRKGMEITLFVIDYTKCMLCGLCTESCPTHCLLMGSAHDLSTYSRDGCIVDFSRLPQEIAWGATTLDALAVAESKVIVQPVE